MTIQWSLVLFTVLSGCGAGLFACTALDEFRGGAASKVRLPACAVAVALLVVLVAEKRSALDNAVLAVLKVVSALFSGP